MTSKKDGTGESLNFTPVNCQLNRECFKVFNAAGTHCDSNRGTYLLAGSERVLSIPFNTNLKKDLEIRIDQQIEKSLNGEIKMTFEPLNKDTSDIFVDFFANLESPSGSVTHKDTITEPMTFDMLNETIDEMKKVMDIIDKPYIDLFLEMGADFERGDRILFPTSAANEYNELKASHMPQKFKNAILIDKTETITKPFVLSGKFYQGNDPTYRNFFQNMINSMEDNLNLPRNFLTGDFKDD